MKGYPPGTQCVITWVAHAKTERFAYSLGNVVTVAQGTLTDKETGLLSQIIQGRCGRQTCDCRNYPSTATPHCWPIAWMKPLEDPGEQTTKEQHLSEDRIMEIIKEEMS